MLMSICSKIDSFNYLSSTCILLRYLIKNYEIRVDTNYQVACCTLQPEHLGQKEKMLYFQISQWPSPALSHYSPSHLPTAPPPFPLPCTASLQLCRLISNSLLLTQLLLIQLQERHIIAVKSLLHVVLYSPISVAIVVPGHAHVTNITGSWMMRLNGGDCNVPILCQTTIWVFDRAH